MEVFDIISKKCILFFNIRNHIRISQKLRPVFRLDGITFWSYTFFFKGTQIPGNSMIYGCSIDTLHQGDAIETGPGI